MRKNIVLIFLFLFAIFPKNALADDEIYVGREKVGDEYVEIYVTDYGKFKIYRYEYYNSSNVNVAKLTFSTRGEQNYNRIQSALTYPGHTNKGYQTKLRDLMVRNLTKQIGNKPIYFEEFLSGEYLEPVRAELGKNPCANSESLLRLSTGPKTVRSGAASAMAKAGCKLTSANYNGEMTYATFNGEQTAIKYTRGNAVANANIALLILGGIDQIAFYRSQGHSLGTSTIKTVKNTFLPDGQTSLATSPQSDIAQQIIQSDKNWVNAINEADCFEKACLFVQRKTGLIPEQALDNKDSFLDSYFTLQRQASGMAWKITVSPLRFMSKR